MDTRIQQEKLGQAVDILNEQGIDCWLTFARETSEMPDPAMKLTVGHGVTWQSAFLVTRDGERIAIVGGPEGRLVRQAGLYPTIVTYDEDYAPALTQTLAELDPGQIAINYSSDVAADGLTHGMYLQLTEALQHGPYLDRLISAGSALGR